MIHMADTRHIPANDGWKGFSSLAPLEIFSLLGKSRKLRFAQQRWKSISEADLILNFDTGIR